MVQKGSCCVSKEEIGDGFIFQKFGVSFIVNPSPISLEHLKYLDNPGQDKHSRDQILQLGDYTA